MVYIILPKIDFIRQILIVLFENGSKCSRIYVCMLYIVKMYIKYKKCRHFKGRKKEGKKHF